MAHPVHPREGRDLSMVTQQGLRQRKKQNLEAWRDEKSMGLCASGPSSVKINTAWQVCRRGERTAHHVWPGAGTLQIASIVSSDEDRLPVPVPAPIAQCALQRPQVPLSVGEVRLPRLGCANGNQMEKVSVTRHRKCPSSIPFTTPSEALQQHPGPCPSPSSPGPGPFPGYGPLDVTAMRNEVQMSFSTWQAPLTASVAWRL